MARGSKKQGENLLFFDAKARLPRQGEPLNSATCTFEMKTRVETDEAGNVVRDPSKPPVERWDHKERKIYEIPSAIPKLRSTKWDYVSNENFLEGYLVDVKVSSYEHQGEEIPTFKLLLKDPEVKELYGLDFRFNYPVLSMLNTFTNLKFEDENGEPVLHWLGVSIASRKDKNGTDRATFYLRSRSPYNEFDKLIDWRFTKNQDTGLWTDDNGVSLPEIEKVQVGNKTVTDNSKLVNFYVKELESIGKILENLKLNDEGELVEDSVSVSGEHDEYDQYDEQEQPTNVYSDTQVEDEVPENEYEEELPF